MDNENSEIRKTTFIPVNCAKGHQIYLVWFPALNRHGFACGLCHILGTTITHGTRLLEVAPARSLAEYVPDAKADLMVGMESKAIHTTCSKGHFVMVVEFPMLKEFGFSCIHCKHYSLNVTDRGKDLEIKMVRDLRPEAMAPHIITDHPAFTVPRKSGVIH